MFKYNFHVQLEQRYGTFKFTFILIKIHALERLLLLVLYIYICIPTYIKYCLQINPQHTVPTLDDDGFIIWDSHAINLYLLEKYGNIDDLYSTDLKTKAIIDQRLHFDSGVAFSLLLRIAVSVY